MVMTAAGRVLHPEPWYEVVGVVRDVPSFPPGLQVEREPVVYHAAAAGALHPVTLSVGFNGPIPPGFIDRFRQIGGEVDATLQLRRVVPLMQFYDEVRGLYRYMAWSIGLLTLSVLLLSAAGIYALTSFTVAQRTREIGIRMALGAHPRRLLFGVFARVLRQLAIGVVVGSLAAATVVYTAGLAFDLAIGLLLVVVAIIVTVGAMAAAGPARRSLHLPASEALRADA